VSQLPAELFHLQVGDARGRTALYNASRSGHADVVRALLALNADVEVGAPPPPSSTTVTTEEGGGQEELQEVGGSGSGGAVSGRGRAASAAESPLHAACAHGVRETGPSQTVRRKLTGILPVSVSLVGRRRPP
jgi:ankyrin repeat protein